MNRDNNSNQSTIRRWFQRLKNLMLFLAAIYIGLLIYLMWNETSLVYPVSKYPRGNWQPDNIDFEEVSFSAADGTNLVGWFLPRTQSNSTTERLHETILLCHGNAENVAQATEWVGDPMRHTLNADVFVFDYRGYGKSEGSPNESGLLDDAESALKYLCQRTGKAPSEVTLIGHSIGGGPAVHLAATQGCKLLILQRTFNSLAETAQSQHPWFPVKYLMRNQYRSESKIANYNGPVFQSHGTADIVIPIELAKRLFDASPTKNKVWYTMPNRGHFDPLPDKYWVDLKAFCLTLE